MPASVWQQQQQPRRGRPAQRLIRLPAGAGSDQGSQEARQGSRSGSNGAPPRELAAVWRRGGAASVPQGSATPGLPAARGRWPPGGAERTACCFAWTAVAARGRGPFRRCRAEMEDRVNECVRGAVFWVCVWSRALLLQPHQNTLPMNSSAPRPGCVFVAEAAATAADRRCSCSRKTAARTTPWGSPVLGETSHTQLQAAGAAWRRPCAAAAAATAAGAQQLPHVLALHACLHAVQLKAALVRAPKVRPQRRRGGGVGRRFCCCSTPPSDTPARLLQPPGRQTSFLAPH